MRNNPATRLDDALLAELGTLSKTLANLVELDNTTAEPALLARLVDMSPEKWVAFSRKYGLEAWFIMPLSANAAEAVNALAHTMEQLAFQRDHDALTGLANRRCFEHYLKLELERAERTQSPLSLVMIDLDRFKQVNDSYGHPCGDEVLQKLGAFLEHSRRSYDLAARYGGEEFMLVLPGLNVWKAKAMAERLLGKFSDMEFSCGSYAPFSMTFSGGVAGVSVENGYNADAAELVRLADDSLYTAKRQGRNRIVLGREAADFHMATMVMAEEKQFLFRNPE